MKRKNTKARRFLRRRRRDRRRGMLLMVILALLAMFAMVAVAFVVLTGQEKRSAREAQKMDQAHDPPQRICDQVFTVVKVGSLNPCSAIKSCSLMEKIYGHEWVGPLPFANIQPICGPQLIEIDLPNAPKYVGAVLTVVPPPGGALSNSPVLGMSTRIVGYNPANVNRAQIMAFENGLLPQQGADVFIVNGVPYSGMGFGYNPGSGMLDAKDGGREVALMPNSPLNWGPKDGNFQNTNPANLYPLGGANADYTAPDYQDPLLGFQVPTANGLVTIEPSLHRPELIQYWCSRETGAGDWSKLDPALLRQIMFRPNQIDHPNFTGSNPAFNAIGGPWDVDCDGDGIPDSVWVDVGLPVRYTADGRAYKPLAAILCIDMDGRLNVNAHGSLAQTVPDYGTGATVAETPVGGAQLAGTNAGVPRGLGYGPAEINLLAALGDVNLYRRLLQGDNASLSGRYGELGTQFPLPSISAAGASVHLQNKWLDYSGVSAGYWTSHFSTTPVPDAYGTPPDIHGFGAIALDPGGRPLYMGNSSSFTTQIPGQPNCCSMGGIINYSPYDINLKGTAPHMANYAPIDNPYGPGELERILRPFDRDASGLPSRLAMLTSLTGDPRASVLIQKRYAPTTEQWSVPTASTALTQTYRTVLASMPDANNQPDRPRNILDMLRARKVPPDKWAQLLPPELLSGLKMNLNRPLIQVPTTTGTQPPFSYDPAAFGQAGMGPTNYIEACQWQARYLYVLMTLLRETNSDVQVFFSEQDLKGDESFRQRRIAQWAINAVCFSTPDSIMVPFKYPVNPFDTANPGWCADNDLSNPYQDSAGRACGVVWGCKPPECVLCETIGFHDRRAVDTAEDSTGKKRTDYPTGAKDEKVDKDLDQRRIPQGSAFFELYCPRSAYNAAAPSDLYVYEGGMWKLDLGRMAPAGDSGQYPVWRLAITESAKKDQNNDVTRRLMEKLDSCSLEPNQTIGGDVTPNGFTLRAMPDVPVKIERIVWFAPQPPPGTMPGAARVYYNHTATRLLPGGQYMVVAPRAVTYVGSKVGGDGQASSQKLEVAAGTFRVTNQLGYPDQTKIKVPLAMWCAADKEGFAKGVGISVSEPLPDDNYYPTPTKAGPTGELDSYDKVYDHPMEITPIRLAQIDPPDPEADKAAKRPIAAEGLLATGSTAETMPNGYKTVFLQRLANPQLPYNAVTNPYRTVDWMPIDLTVFNGEDKKPADWDPQKGGGNWDPDDANDSDLAHVLFGTRQRGRPGDFNIWSPISDRPTGGGTGDQNDVFSRALKNSLGYLNEAFQPTMTGNGNPYVGDPNRPFPWITWNSRPYVSELELLQVPATTAARLYWEGYGPMANFGLKVATHPYSPATAQDVPFPHLMNFFHSRTLAGGAVAPKLHRILDYVGVPSRFILTDTVLNPSTVTGGPGAHWFHPPFNRVSSYREPGRINLNTIACAEVYQGLMNYTPGIGDTDGRGIFYGKFVASRREDGADNPDPSLIDPSMPTRFAKPFRSSGGASLVPLPSLHPDAPSRGEAECTLLRSDPANPDRPLFETDALTVPAGKPDYYDWDRNSYFRYQSIQRLANLTTTRSNVFAVWITVGYFEVTPWPAGMDAAHPDGMQLGQELGSDTGQVERHRAFYLIDRSIPCGFQRGQDINSGNAVFIRRYIE